MKPSVFFIEESKYKETGRLKIDNYIIFELNRQSRDGGGLALGCAKELQPVWLREGSSQVEAMSVEIYVKKKSLGRRILFLEILVPEIEMENYLKNFWTEIPICMW